MGGKTQGDAKKAVEILPGSALLRCTRISGQVPRRGKVLHMKTIQAKERAAGLMMAALVSAAMGAAASFLVLWDNPQAAELTPVPILYASNIVLSVVLGLVTARVLPLGKWGRALAGKAHANPPGLPFTLLNAVPLAVGNTVLLSLALSFLGVFTARSHAPAEAVAQMPPLPVMWLGSWGKLLLPTLLASYVISVVLSPIAAAVGLNRPSGGEEQAAQERTGGTGRSGT